MHYRRELFLQERNNRFALSIYAQFLLESNFLHGFTQACLSRKDLHPAAFIAYTKEMTMAAIASNSSDEQLLQQLKKGDATAFKKIYDRHAMFLALEAYLILGCANSASKAVEEVFSLLAHQPLQLAANTSLEVHLSQLVWEHCTALKKTQQLSTAKQLDAAIAASQRIQLAIQAMQHKLSVLPEQDN